MCAGAAYHYDIEVELILVSVLKGLLFPIDGIRADLHLKPHREDWRQVGGSM
jgi:hypothetical protein